MASAIKTVGSQSHQISGKLDVSSSYETTITLGKITKLCAGIFTVLT